MKPTRSTIQRAALCALLAALALAEGCASTTGTGPYQAQGEQQRDTAKATALTNQAEPVMGSDPKRAEELLKQALTADLYYGPAHNNLGVLYLRQQKLYEAAGEFEWARKVLPGHPDPRFNLALTLEGAGRTQDAIAMYDTALAVYPGHIETIQALARLQVRSGKVDSRTPELLREVAMRGQSDQWKEWARRQMASRGSE